MMVLEIANGVTARSLTPLSGIEALTFLPKLENGLAGMAMKPRLPEALRPMGNGSPEKISQQVLEAVRSVVGPTGAPLHEPSFSGDEVRYLEECIDSTFVSSVGPFVDRFESELRDVTGADHVVATTSGTAALQVALRSAGVGPGDEVLVPALTFVATANAVSYLGAVPHFVDCEERTLGLDSVALREHLETAVEIRDGRCVNRENGRVIRAMIPVHTFGHPAAIDDLLEVAVDFPMDIVEDATESLGSTRRGRHTGTIGRAGTLSFNGNKIITTGGGGAILTDDPELASKARHLTTTAKVAHSWEYLHDEIGYNYRLPNINAALGCAQLEDLPDLIERKRRLFKSYTRAFAEIAGVEVVEEPDECSSNYWLQTIRLGDSFKVYKDSILGCCHAAGYGLRPAWTPLHWLQPYRNCPRADLPVAENLYGTLINLPSSAHLV